MEKSIAYTSADQKYHLCKAARVAYSGDAGTTWRLGTVVKISREGCLVQLDEKVASSAGKVLLYFADLLTSETARLVPVLLMGQNFNILSEKKVMANAYSASNPLRPMLRNTASFDLTNSAAQAIYRLVNLWCFDGLLPMGFVVAVDKLIDKVKIPSNFGELRFDRSVSVTPESEKTVAITPRMMVIRKSNYTMKQAVQVIAHECCHLWVFLYDVKKYGAHAVWEDGKDTLGHGQMFMSLAPKLARHGITLARYGETTVPLGGVGGLSYYVVADQRNVDGALVTTLRSCSSNFDREIEHLKKDDRIAWWIVESTDKGLKDYVTRNTSRSPITNDSKVSILAHVGRVIASNQPGAIDSAAASGLEGFEPAWKKRNVEDRKAREQEEEQRRLNARKEAAEYARQLRDEREQGEQPEQPEQGTRRPVDRRPGAAQPRPQAPQAPRATYVDESDRDTDFNGMELDA